MERSGRYGRAAFMHLEYTNLEVLMSANSSRRLSQSALRMDPAARPDWVSGAERQPRKGEQVLCTAGPAEVTVVLGKTGDGTRLLELRLDGEKQPPFFVAASNVLVAPAAPAMA
jgi:hypothetical protein